MASFALAQDQPAHFMIGQDQFKGVQIYDIIQDDHDTYWISTNKGLFKHDYYEFLKVKCLAAKSDQFFNFVKSPNGVIYAHNLNDQVVAIKNGVCEVYYEILPEEHKPDIFLSISDDGSLIIGCAKIISINEKHEIKKHKVTANYYGRPFQLQDRSIIYYISNTDSIIKYSKGKCTYEIIDYKADKTGDRVVQFFNTDKGIHGINSSNFECLYFDPQTLSVSPMKGNIKLELESKAVRIYQTADLIWIAGTLPGVQLINFDQAKQDVWFKDIFISDVYQDNEGNYLLSTFDHGIIVIPDLNVPDVIPTNSVSPIVSMYKNQKGLFMGSSVGEIYLYNNNGEVSQFWNSGNRPIEGIYGDSKGDWILYDDGKVRLNDLTNGQYRSMMPFSLKDAVFKPNHEVVFGSNLGLLSCQLNEATAFFFPTHVISEGYRVYAMTFDSINNDVYTAGSKGVLRLDQDNVEHFITDKNEVLFANYLTFHDNKLYAVKSGEGIAVYENDAFIRTIKPFLGEELLDINKIEVRDDYIIACTTFGLFQLDLQGNVIRSYHSRYGFSAEHIIDFILDDDHIWVSHAKGVQKIRINADFQEKKLKVKLEDVLVNDQPVISQKVTSFESDQRKFSFKVSVPTLKNQEIIKYYYQLKGYDDTWQINSYKNNKMTYSALSPGEYTFIVKPEIEGIFGDPLEYEFTIAYPLYLRWWFLSMIGLLLILITTLFYKRQLTVQKRKSDQINELNASKLTAIQSQMNPHFIFNSLNSIQDLVLKGDVENSYTYITTFSDLVRKTLNYSDKDLIDFEQEVQLLEVYLSLEKLRFKQDFNYRIETSDIEDIKIPPLLVQPFVENALIHGLLHREGIKELSVSFELKEDALLCTVMDNGVGRDRAKEIRKRQRADHESFSGKAIKRRFEILSQVYEGDYDVVYEDLVSNGEAIGTKVILRMPYKQKY